MLTAYVDAAMERAAYEILEDDRSYCGEIPGFQGFWANADSLEACRRDLRETLETWILVRVADHLPLPVVDGVDLTIREEVA